jgi:TP901 family phage tail tape measure protein
VADYNLGTATGKIVIDYDGKGVTQAAAGAKQMEASHTKAGAAVAKVGSIAGVAGLAIAAGIGLAVKTAASFEQELSNIQAVSGNTAGQMELVRAKALQIGKDTTFSATEAAQAIEELSKAGISTTDVLNGAADATVSLAAATGVDMPTAATIASNAMNQFQLSAQQMPHIVDILAGAANSSAIDIRDLGESMKYVGPVAHGLGVSIEDTSTALALLGNQGIKGSQAGTSLRSILTNLTPTTKKATGAFKELGLITKDGANQFYDAQGRVKPLDQVIGILHNSMKGLTAQEQATFAKKAFGLESMPAVSDIPH